MNHDRANCCEQDQDHAHSNDDDHGHSHDHGHAHGNTGWRKWLESGSTLGCGLLIGVGFTVHAWRDGIAGAFGGESGQAPLAATAAYIAAIAIGGWGFPAQAWRAIRRLSPDIYLLMTIAVIGAAGLGDWLEAAMVVFLFSVSEALEGWSMSRSRHAIESLMRLSPEEVCVLDAQGVERIVAAAQVAVGSRVLVKPGEKVPLDGRVTLGDSTVNQAPVTGESMPVAKYPGLEVYAGTINGEGALQIETTRPANDSAIARIVRLVTEAQANRAPAEQWVKKFARYYTPAIMALASAFAIAPPLLFSQSWSEWFYRALVLLVIACPCALVISTPVAIVAAMTRAARAGVLVKGGLYMELAGKIRAVAFDKTGTITLGRPRVSAIVPLNGHTEDNLLERAASIGSHSAHPLSRAIAKHARERGIGAQAAANLQAVHGKGAVATIDGRGVWLGSQRYLAERGLESPEMRERMDELASAGASVVAVGTDEHVCGLIGVADEPRHDARAAVDALRAEGVEHIVLLTGDNANAARAMAEHVGADAFLADLLPEDKVREIEALVRRYPTAMIGDGVNDAPALARATLGVAMGAAGSDAALETADVALMGDDLGKLAWLIRHSRRTLRVIRQNVAASVGVKVVFIGLTVFGAASLWAAIAADTGVSLLVILNALRLLGDGAVDGVRK